MVSSAQFVSPKPALVPPGTQPGLPGAGSAGGPSFSQFLNDQPEMLTPPAHTDPVPAAPDSAAPAPNTAATNAAARRKEASSTPAKVPGASGTRPPEGTAGQPTDATGTAAGAATAAADAASEAGDTTATQAAKDEDSQQASSLTEFAQLIGLALPGQPAAATSPAADAPDTTALTGAADATTAAATGTRALRPTRGTPGADDAGTDADTRPTVSAGDDGSTRDRRLTDTAVRGADAPRPKAVDLAADKAGALSRSPSTDTLQASSARVTAESASTPARSIGTVEGAAPNFAALLAQSAPATVAGGDLAPAPVTGQVQAALHSPAFAPELAASVSLLAADGVQHAELQLNPADMGPVAIQIVVDGAQAQVSFHAVQAETRQALEQSLPDLAAALQGQGLTLSGGGVFQQSPRDAQGGGDERSSGSSRAAGRSGGAGGSPITAAGSTATASVRRAAGLLDTFA